MICRCTAGRVQNGAAAFDFGGNWLDTEIGPIHGIAGSNGSALIRHNANFSQSTVYGAAYELGSGGYTGCALVRIGADARSGPLQLGGEESTTDATDRFDVTTESQSGNSWSWHMFGSHSGGVREWRRFAKAGTDTVLEMSGGGLKIGSYSGPNNTSPSYGIQMVGDSITLEGTVTENGTVND